MKLPTLVLEHVLNDARYAVRGMRRAPAFYATAALMLALGIGINAAIFSVFSHVLLAPLQFVGSDSLYVVTSHAASLGDARRLSSGPDFRDYRDQNTDFTGVAAAISHFTLPWVGDGEPRVVDCTAVTQDFFNVLGIRPALGRLYAPDDFRHLQNTAVLITWKFWKHQFNSDPHIVGRTLHLEDAASEIVGVLPPMPDLYGDSDLVLTLTTEPSWPFMDWRANKSLDVIGRLKPGVTRAAAQQQLTTILGRGESEPKDVQVQLTLLKEYIVGPVTRQLDIIMAAVTLVLVVTCMNTAALLLSRSVKRAPELAVRLGLGASRGRIRQQLLVEGLLLSALGGALGVALAAASVGLVRWFPGVALPRIDGLHVNVAAILASVSVVMLTGLLFALLPAGMLARMDLAGGLRSGRTETGKAQRRPFSALIVGEVACAVVLTVCAGLLVRSFIRVQSLDLGFEPAKVLTAYLRTNYFDPRGYAFWNDVVARTATAPGAAGSALSDCMPAAWRTAQAFFFSIGPTIRTTRPPPRVAGSAPTTSACSALPSRAAAASPNTTTTRRRRWRSSTRRRRGAFSAMKTRSASVSP